MKTITLKLPAEFANIVRSALVAEEDRLELQANRWDKQNVEVLFEQYETQRKRVREVRKRVEAAFENERAS